MARVRRRRRCCAYLVFVVAGLALTIARPLDAASFALAPGEREEAIRVLREALARHPGFPGLAQELARLEDRIRHR